MIGDFSYPDLSDTLAEGARSLLLVVPQAGYWVHRPVPGIIGVGLVFVGFASPGY